MDLHTPFDDRLDPFLFTLEDGLNSIVVKVLYPACPSLLTRNFGEARTSLEHSEVKGEGPIR